MLKVLWKIKKCSVWQWKLFALKIDWLDWEYAFLSKTWEFWKTIWTVSIWIDKNKKIVLIKNYRHAIDKISWELVRWWLEKWLTVEENAIKEFKEETWIDELPLKTIELANLSADTWILGDMVSYVLLEFDDFSKFDVFWKKDWEYEQIYEVKLFEKEEFEKLIKDQKLYDAFTISAYGILKANGII